MAIHLRVVGRVQGVGFRWFVREVARRHALAGWVRNVADGAVEVAAEGPPNALAALRAALRRGPDGARVDDLVDLPAPGAGELAKPFAILK